jgi:hypothetical protein
MDPLIDPVVTPVVTPKGIRCYVTRGPYRPYGPLWTHLWPPMAHTMDPSMDPLCPMWRCERAARDVPSLPDVVAL